MKTLTVNLKERSYPIHIGQSLLGQDKLLVPHIHGNQVLLVSNDIVAPLYLEKALSTLGRYQCETVILPDGEKYKTLDTATLIFDALLQHRFDRQCTLIALGGGVVGDITGFAAACYQRGVNFIQIPTTLLAQVDSSVGGKTGVNHPLGKNMIGAFHQPQCVLIDINTLDTLDDQQFSAGLAEVIKYGLIQDEDFFVWLENNMNKLLQRDAEMLTYAIERSCQTKADIVAADEKESGQRALLNLGHTFGHAIEAGMGYGTWLHGEAVGTGMLMAADLSRRQNNFSQSQLKRIRTLLNAARLPVKTPIEMDAERFLELMAVDKKVQAGVIRLVLLNHIGSSYISDDHELKLLRDMLDAFHHAAN